MQAKMEKTSTDGYLRRQVFSSVWDAIEDTPFEAEKMKLKSKLMVGISEIIRGNGWSQQDAAQKCGVTLPRIAELLSGKINQFSIDSLCGIVTSLGRKVEIAIA